MLLVGLSRGVVASQKRSALNAEQQKAFLMRRLPSGAIKGTFAAFGSFLYAALDVAIHTNDKEIGKTELHSPFPDFYKPQSKRCSTRLRYKRDHHGPMTRKPITGLSRNRLLQSLSPSLWPTSGVVTTEVFTSATNHGPIRLGWTSIITAAIPPMILLSNR